MVSFFQVDPWKCQLTNTVKVVASGRNSSVSFRGRGVSDRRLSASLPGEM